MGPLFSPVESAFAELVIKRSRFLSEAGPIVSRETSQERINQVRQEHPDATHVVYAFSFGGINERQFGMSDDGEPRNTAGRPVLEVLKGSGLTNCLVTVVRYFGGTKLGTGGLVHAYSEAAQKVLSIVPREELVVRIPKLLRIPYDLYQIVRQEIACRGIEVREERFLSEIFLEIGIPESELAPFSSTLLDISRGAVTLEDCFT